MTFNYAGAVIQHFTVPAGLKNVTIQALGAAGGVTSSSSQANAAGGSETANIPVTPDDKLSLIVGEYGQNAPAGSAAFGGGGASGASGGGGGGGSFGAPG